MSLKNTHFSNFIVLFPGAPLTYFNGGGVLVIFWGSEILAQSDFFGSMEDAGIFLGRKKKQKDFSGLR